MMVFRFLISLLAITLIVVGFLTMISPVPMGFVLIILGFIMLVLVNPRARPLLRWFRKKWPWLDRVLDEAQETAPPAIAEPLKETDPDAQPEEDRSGNCARAQ